MNFKLVYSGLNGGSLPLLVTLGDEAVVFDLKRNLQQIFKKPKPNSIVKLQGMILKDHDLMVNVLATCKSLDKPAVLEAFYGGKLVCCMRFVDGGDPHESNMVDASRSQNNNPRGFPNISPICSGFALEACSNSLDLKCVPKSSSRSSQGDVSGCDTEQCCLEEESSGNPTIRNVMPENRHHAVVIEGDPSEGINIISILKFLADRLKESPEPHSLNFSVCAPLVASDDNSVIIVCKDSNSSNWIQRTICPPNKCVTFINHFELVRRCMVIPLPNPWSLCRIFKILEKQNCPLDTSFWCVTNHTLRQPCSDDFTQEAIDPGDTYIDLILYIDKASADYIANHCNELRYLVWRLPVQHCEGIC